MSPGASDRPSSSTVAKAFNRATAASAAIFLDKLVRDMPFKVEAIQVDGGSEFMAEFERACQDKAIRLYVLPPKCPQMSGAVERCNGAWRYEFYSVYDLPRNVDDINPILDSFQNLSNHHRPHGALGCLTPAQYLPKLQAKDPLSLKVADPGQWVARAPRTWLELSRFARAADLPGRRINVGRNMPKSAIEEIKELKAQLESKTEQAKAEALDKASEAIGFLRDLGLDNDTILKELGFRGRAKDREGREAGPPKDEPCSICRFRTEPPHDGRSHRGQAKKKPFTTEDLEQKGLTKI
jgi:hypothetical protein